MKCKICGANTAQPEGMHECVAIIMTKADIIKVLIDTLTVQALDSMDNITRYNALVDLGQDPDTVDIVELYAIQNSRALFAIDQAKQLGLLDGKIAYY